MYKMRNVTVQQPNNGVFETVHEDWGYTLHGGEDTVKCLDTSQQVGTTVLSKVRTWAQNDLGCRRAPKPQQTKKQNQKYVHLLATVVNEMNHVTKCGKVVTKASAKIRTCMLPSRARVPTNASYVPLMVKPYTLESQCKMC